MGLFDWLSGSKAAPAGVARQPAATLRAALLGKNDETLPFIVRDGAAEGVDLVAEWKIVDARWYEFFAKASLTRVFKVLMKFDEARGEIRSVDQEWSVAWTAGVPTLALSAEAFRGQKKSFSFGGAYGIREDGTIGQIYKYNFTTGEIKNPLIEIAQQQGWGWRGVAFGKL